MEKQKIQKSINPLAMFGVIGCLLVVFNCLLLLFTINNANTVKLLKKEVLVLEQDEKLVRSSQDLYETYKSEIDQVTGVFPDEETIPGFIQALEGAIRLYADEYSVKFVSLTPIVEQEKLFLLLAVTMKTDMTRLIEFLGALETIPYMTHITSMNAKTPEGYSGKSEISLGLKVYVQNPFSAK